MPESEGEQTIGKESGILCVWVMEMDVYTR